MAAIFGAIPFILPEDVRVTVWLLLLAMTTLAQVGCGHAHDEITVPAIRAFSLESNWSQSCEIYDGAMQQKWIGASS